MKRNIIASVIAASVAFTSIGSAPAVAGDRGENTRLIIGITTLAIIAGALAENNKKGQVVTRRYDDPKPRGGHDDRRGHDDRDGRGRGHGEKYSKVLPAYCKFEIRSDRGPRDVYGKSCLEQNYRNARALPRDCEFRVRTSRGPRNVYGARCLQQNGYKVASRGY